MNDTNTAETNDSIPAPFTPFTLQADHSLRSMAARAMNPLIEKVSVGEELWWDIGYTLMPTGPGQLQLHTIILLVMRSPVLDVPWPSMAIPVASNGIFADERLLEHVVSDAVRQLRELRSAMLSELAVNGGGEPKGLIL